VIGNLRMPRSSMISNGTVPEKPGFVATQLKQSDTGGLSIAAARWPSVLLGILTAVAAMSGPPSPQELSKRFRELSSQSGKLRRFPAEIMFRHVKRNFGSS
jgi:hypothetical protein